MKNMLTDAVGGVGLVCLTAGIYLKYGPAEALLAGGAVLLTIAIVPAIMRGLR
ncbi:MULTISPECIES: hypothetical protein [Cupriavidus]|uniref:hypothetical protein n=1 Tax=Cupriavidus TaxID=106589 RepID=UPI0018CF83F9|nr:MULTISPECIES: hypothetical protein [Cupriavidus]QWC87712.1 hypothetical protein KB891_11725 [Cupriavidus metallidurans]